MGNVLNDMAYQIFVSHTQRDKEFCDMFDVACARVGIKAFRSEFETIEAPAWESIKKEMKKSQALFLLVGSQLVTYQSYPDESWRHTQNWIAFEVGLACQMNIDVWVFCDEGVEMNFPVPYFNNYLPFGMRDNQNFEFVKAILTDYRNRHTFSVARHNWGTYCPYDDCNVEFNLPARFDPGASIKCPQCLRDIIFPNGFLLS